MYPEDIEWPKNVKREIHLSPREHPAFYASQRFTLNITRAAMKQAGYSPSVRLFEAGACAAPVISDWWKGSTACSPIGREVLVAASPERDPALFARRERRAAARHGARGAPSGCCASTRRNSAPSSSRVTGKKLMTTFLLMRHGETDAVGKSIMGWRPGWHLNANGRKQVERLAARLAASADPGDLHQPAGAGR